jgi:hypothetical protein
MLEIRTVVTVDVPVVCDVPLDNVHNLTRLSVEANDIAADYTSEEIKKLADKDGVPQDLLAKAAECYSRIADASAEAVLVVAQMQDIYRRNQKKEDEPQTGVE